MIKKVNQKGFSLVEILISLGVMGAIGVGVATLITQSEKKKSEMNQRMNRMTIEKMVETHFYSDKGCGTIKNKKIGDVIALDPKKFPLELSKTKLQELRISSFESTDESGVHGIAKLTLTLKETKSPTEERTYTREIPVPVNINSTSGSLVIEDCNLNRTQVLQEVVKKVCEGTFADKTTGLTCADAMELVEKMAIESICGDLNGSGSPALTDIHCNQNQIHANKECPPGEGVVGFDADGKLLPCRPVGGSSPTKKNCTWTSWSPTPATFCAGSKFTQTRTCIEDGTIETQEAGGAKSDASCCATWSPWTPDTSGTCDNKQVTQTRSCLDAGSTKVESQLVTGTKECSKYMNWRIQCFIAGTQVTTASGKTESIENLRVSDQVLTFDEATRETVVRPVKKIFHHEESESILYAFNFLNGKTVTSNDKHLIYIPAINNYQSADEIFWRWKRGEVITLQDEKGKEILVTNIKQSFEKVKLYNIHVEGLYDTKDQEHQLNHNFFANGVLVHNEKAMWEPEVRELKSYTCCKDVLEKESYPRGIFCYGYKSDKEEYDACVK